MDEHTSPLRRRVNAYSKEPMRLKTLNGAPLCEQLDFAAESLLEPEEAVRFLYEGSTQPSSHESTSASLKWRRLAAKDEALRTGWSQPYLPVGAMQGSNSEFPFPVPGYAGSAGLAIEDTTNFDTTTTFPSIRSFVDDFVHHSLTFHDTLLSSQVAAPEDADRTVSSSSFLSTSFETASTGLDTQSEDHSQFPLLRVPPNLALTPLGSLPSPQHLHSIYPQTPTPNILCVLAAPPTDREVVIRRGGYKMNLREITVADDTRAEFKVSFWGRPRGEEDPQDDVAQTLDRVKVGDILLLRNIALNVYRNDVFGQSLRRSIMRVRTSIDVLMSAGGFSSRQLGALPPAITANFTRVKRWAAIHIASDLGDSRKRKADHQKPKGSTKRSTRSNKRYDANDETLPPDTLEAV